MTAITTNRTWIKFIVVIFLIIIGLAGGFYAYTKYFTTPVQEEVVPTEPAPDRSGGV